MGYRRKFLREENRRGRTTLTSRVVSTRVVTPTTIATTMSTIPTGVYAIAEHGQLQPRLASQPFRCRRRPHQQYRQFLRNLNFHSKDGMENNLLMFYIAISPDITYGRTFAHAIMSIGMINYDYNEVSDSYGKNSPDTDFDHGSRTYYVMSSGLPYRYSFSDASYGLQIRSKILVVKIAEHELLPLRTFSHLVRWRRILLRQQRCL